MRLGLEKKTEIHADTKAARAPHASISLLLVLSLAFAACEEEEPQDSGRAMIPSNLNPTAGLDSGVANGAILPGAGGGTLGGAVWPIGNDAAVGALPDGAVGPSTTRRCNRDVLGLMIDRFFLALKAHDTSSMPFAPGVKFTENGQLLKLGEGIWKTAGATQFKHTAYDVETCNTVTEAVITENTELVPFGVRLRFEPPAPGTTASGSQQILEVETIVVRAGTYLTPSDPVAIAASAGEMWEQLVPTSQRATRAQLEQIVDDYFVHFPAGACHFAPQCLRFENGFSPGTCSVGLSCAPAGAGQNARPRLKVIDVEAGIAIGFVMFANSYTDFHMFRVRGGQVQGLHAILAAAPAPGW
jgi:hypothetical protein